MRTVEEARLEETVQISWYPSAALTVQKLVRSCTKRITLEKDAIHTRLRVEKLRISGKAGCISALPLSAGDRLASKQRVTLAPFLQNLARDFASGQLILN
jgi:hypothetical protein